MTINKEPQPQTRKAKYLLGKNMHSDRELSRLTSQFDLRKALVGERAAHNERGVVHGTAKINQPSFG